jgi:hypothetical protein
MPTDPLATLRDVLSTVRVLFTRPGFEKFLVVATGWIMTQGPMHCVTEALVATDVARRRHWEAYHRFFSRGSWEPDRLGFWVLQRLRPWIKDGVLRLALDDTLCPHKGPALFGLGTHVDAVRSTRKHKVFAFGHGWVVLAALVRVPFSTRVWALPLLFRLYRTKAEAADSYAKKTELARDMLAIVLGWTETERWTLHVALDQGYTNATVLGALSPRVIAVGAMRPDAALTAPPDVAAQRRGRRCGARLPSPEQLAQQSSTPWRRVTAHLYGRTETVVYKSVVAQWSRVTGARAVRVVIVRCSQGRVPYRIFVGTDACWSVAAILEHYAGRWAIEVFFRDAKQLFGLADTPATSEAAVRRVVPLVGLLLSLLTVWFAEVYAHPVASPPVRPWYAHKRHLCFADVVRTARRVLERVDVLAWAEQSRTWRTDPRARPGPEQLCFAWAA